MQAIASAIIGLLGIVCLHETYAPRVLTSKCRKAQRHNPNAYSILDLEPHKGGMGPLLGQVVRPGPFNCCTDLEQMLTCGQLCISSSTQLCSSHQFSLL